MDKEVRFALADLTAKQEAYDVQLAEVVSNLSRRVDALTKYVEAFNHLLEAMGQNQEARDGQAAARANQVTNLHKWVAALQEQLDDPTMRIPS